MIESESFRRIESSIDEGRNGAFGLLGGNGMG